jgi:hypothetical protein
MDETQNLSAPEDSQPPVQGSCGSADETTDLSGAQTAQPGVVVPGQSMESDPTKIGRYRIIRRLGQGGFGRV